MKKKDFTLIELLVVIAIIAILAAMLLPALGKVKEVSRKSACLNNQKQLIMALTLYRNDYNDFIPPWSANGTKWYKALVEYTKNDIMFRCPSHRSYNKPLDPNANAGAMSIGINGAQQNAFYNKWFKASGLKNVSTLIYVGDSPGYGTDIYNQQDQYVDRKIVCLGKSDPLYPHTTGNCTHFYARHAKSVNFGFVAGHAVNYDYRVARQLCNQTRYFHAQRR